MVLLFITFQFSSNNLYAFQLEFLLKRDIIDMYLFCSNHVFKYLALLFPIP